jgi:hypothetical protein
MVLDFFLGWHWREHCLAELPIGDGIFATIRWESRAAQQYPDVNFIIPHLGSFSDDWRCASPKLSARLKSIT